jgi:methionine--tRNA ligase beta chain
VIRFASSFFKNSTHFHRRSIHNLKMSASEAPKVLVEEMDPAIAKASEPVEKPKKEKKPVPPKEPARPVDDVTRLRIIVGKLKRVWAHPDADKLWCEEVDCGDEEPRLIASGLREYYKTPEDMEGRMVLVLANLKPRPMRGFTSHGMLLCASTEDRGVELIEPPKDAKLGERVTIGDLVGEPDEILNAKKNPWEAVCEHFKTGKDEPIAMFKDIPLMTSAGIPRAATLKDVPIR